MEWDRAIGELPGVGVKFSTEGATVTLLAVLVAAMPLLPVASLSAPGQQETAVFAGGCFWGVEAVFEPIVFVGESPQRREAESFIAELTARRVFAHPVVTEVRALRPFYLAEPYHQDYAARHPDDPYIVINDIPKLKRLRRLFPGLYRDEARSRRRPSPSRLATARKCVFSRRAPTLPHPIPDPPAERGGGGQPPRTPPPGGRGARQR